MTPPPARAFQARILHALAGGEGALSSIQTARLADDVDPRRAAEALEELEESGLVGVDEGGIVRRGWRGSPLDAQDVASRLRTRGLGRPLEIHAVVGSTNDLVLDRAVHGAPPGLVVAAELQTAGRGRRGRTFESLPGLGLWSTTLLPAPDDPAAAPRLSIVAAIAVAESIEDLTDASPVVKWPNDVRLSGRKVCGVLVEARSRGRALFPVAGIGINVHHLPADFPPELRGTAASVEEITGVAVARGALLAAMLSRLEDLLDRERSGRLELAAVFAPRDETLGRDVVLETDAGRWEGRGAGLAADGALRLDVPGRGTMEFHAGEATVRAVA